MGINNLGPVDRLFRKTKRKAAPKADQPKASPPVDLAALRIAVDASRGTQQALGTLLAAVAGYRSVAPEDPTGHSYCREAVELGNEHNWKAHKVSSTEREAMRQAAQFTYNRPENENHRDQALEMLREIQTYEQGQTWLAERRKP